MLGHRFSRTTLALMLKAMFASAALLPLVLVGCERKEKVLDIKTPGADVKVERSLDTGQVDVDVERKK